MKSLRTIISTFSSEDTQGFESFIQRQKRKSKRRDLELFRLLCKGGSTSTKDVIMEMYGSYNRPAFYGVINRLKEEVHSFLLLKRRIDHPSPETRIHGLISLSDHLNDNHQPELAWKNLAKAEVIAEESEHYQLLEEVYRKQVTLGSSIPEADLDVIYEKYQKNKKEAEKEASLEIAFSFLKKHLHGLSLGSEQIDFDKLVSTTFERFGLKKEAAQNLKSLYTLASIVRIEMFSRKDFYSFEPYLVSSYKALKRQQQENKRYHFYELSLRYMIAHVYYRNRKFDLAGDALQKLEEGMGEHNKHLYSSFYARYCSLKAAIEGYTGKNQDAITTLTEFLESKDLISNSHHHYNALLNLCIAHFAGNDFKMSNRVLYQFPHSDGFLAKKMGDEWVMKKQMVEILIQYELGNPEIALTRIRSFEKKYKPMFKFPIYGRMKVFLGFIKKVIDSPYEVSDKEFIAKVEGTLSAIPYEREDTQAVAFYCWLKSKMYKADYYQTLLETIRIHQEEIR